jgi:hypothetical protein
VQFLSLVNRQSSVFCRSANAEVLFALEESTQGVTNELGCHLLSEWCETYAASGALGRLQAAPQRTGPDGRHEEGLPQPYTPSPERTSGL